MAAQSITKPTRMSEAPRSPIPTQPEPDCLAASNQPQGARKAAKLLAPAQPSRVVDAPEYRQGDDPFYAQWNGPYHDVAYNALLVRNFACLPLDFLMQRGKPQDGCASVLTRVASYGNLCAAYVEDERPQLDGQKHTDKALVEATRALRKLACDFDPEKLGDSLAGATPGPDAWLHWLDVDKANDATLRLRGSHAQLVCFYRTILMPTVAYLEALGPLASRATEYAVSPTSTVCDVLRSAVVADGTTRLEDRLASWWTRDMFVGPLGKVWLQSGRVFE